VLKLAEPEGYVRIFLDEGQPMLEILNICLSLGVMLAYTQRLLGEFKTTSQKPCVMGAIPSEVLWSNQVLAEPLSEREFEVLQLLGHGLTNQEIARNHSSPRTRLRHT
jgi:LuxR family maltose regulon positive regulatory protein